MEFGEKRTWYAVIVLRTVRSKRLTRTIEPSNLICEKTEHVQVRFIIFGTLLQYHTSAYSVLSSFLGVQTSASATVACLELIS